MSRTTNALLSFALAFAFLAGGMFAFAHGVKLLHDWQKQQEQARNAPSYPPAIEARLEEAATRCAAVSAEALRAFHSLPDETLTATIVRGRSSEWIERAEREIAQAWGWNLARECEPMRSPD